MSVVTPNAKLLVSINGGALTSGGITIPASAVVTFAFENTVGWESYRLEMLPPPGGAIPAGWTNESGLAVYTGVIAPPPAVTFPAITDWGKWPFTLIVNDGVGAGTTDGDTLLNMVSVNGTVDVAPREGKQMSTLRAWAGAIQTSFRIFDAFVSAGGVTPDATTLVKGIVKLAGDLAGTALLPVVAKVNGIIYPSATLTVGQVPRAAGAGTMAYGALDPTVAASFVAASEARGDLLYRGASAWARLAAGTAGKVLQTNGAGADPTWVTPTSPLLLQNFLTTAGTAVANVDTLIYTVPASPSGNFRALLAAVVGRLKTGLTGAGTVTVTVGTTSGGNDLVLATAIVTATTVGTELGVASAAQGTSFPAANLYNALLAAGATVYVRMATTGVVTVAPTFEWTLFGALMGT